MFPDSIVIKTDCSNVIIQKKRFDTEYFSKELTIIFLFQQSCPERF